MMKRKILAAAILSSLANASFAGAFDVHYRAMNTDPNSNTIHAELKVINRDADIDLSDVSIDYFFTKEGTGFVGVADFSAVQGSLFRAITGNVAFDFSVDDRANISFGGQSGILKKNDFISLQFRIHKNDWSNHNQLNDPSFDGSLVALTPVTTITVNGGTPSVAESGLIVDSVQTLRLTVPQGDKNAVAFVTFTPQSLAGFGGDSVIFDLDGQSTALNDQGQGVDETAGDGIFSGPITLDEQALQNNEATFQRKLASLNSPSVITFSGRSILEENPFVAQTLSSSTVTLADGSTAEVINADTVVNPALPGLTDVGNTLMITDPRVVANKDFTFDPCASDAFVDTVNPENTLEPNNVNPDNPWSIKTLLSNLNNTTLSDQEFIHEWLRSWMNDVEINSFTITARPNIIQYFGGWDGINASTLDINNLPFRLSAIVNRLDLAKSQLYGPSEAGETRFVFHLMNTRDGACAVGAGGDEMTVIFEYGDTATSCTTQQTRANDWLALDDIAKRVGRKSAYMAALKAITDDVTVNGSAQLNQVRTNDFAFDRPGRTGTWQLREFRLNDSGLLAPFTIAQTPEPAIFRQNSDRMAAYVEEHAEAVLCEQHQIGTSYAGKAFLGASADYSSNNFWEVSFADITLPTAFPACYQTAISSVGSALTLPVLIESEVRHKLSLNTCDDCHARETGTFFTHIKQNRQLSGFLSGITVADPKEGATSTQHDQGIMRSWNDLARRDQFLTSTALGGCGIHAAGNFNAQQSLLKFVH